MDPPRPQNSWTHNQQSATTNRIQSQSCGNFRPSKILEFSDDSIGLSRKHADDPIVAQIEMFKSFRHPFVHFLQITVFYVIHQIHFEILDVNEKSKSGIIRIDSDTSHQNFGTRSKFILIAIIDIVLEIRIAFQTDLWNLDPPISEQSQVFFKSNIFASFSVSEN
jgi:hypothetical protein